MTNTLVIHPAIEPGVIDDAMIISCIKKEGPKGEAGRLFKQEGIHFNELKYLNMEFKRIIRIDHLWVMTLLTKLSLAQNLIEKIENLQYLTNLIELNLSFNKIVKIENLDELVNLEILSLFHNQIQRIENLDRNQKLMVFSVGENLISDYREVKYLKRFRELRSLSFKGNPCCKEPNTSAFVAACLPQLTYLDYIRITPELVEQGNTFFRLAIHAIEEEHDQFEHERRQRVVYEEKLKVCSLSFVEYLSGCELFDAMFERDDYGTTLLCIGGELQTAQQNYREGYGDIMGELVKVAQAKYRAREQDKKMFEDVMKEALDESLKESRKLLAEYEEKKQQLLASLKAIRQMLKAGEMKIAEAEEQASDLTELFSDLLQDTWKKLMKIEMLLYERCEEMRVAFAVNMQEMVLKLLDTARQAFGRWRELEVTWSSYQTDVVTKYIGAKRLPNADPPQGLLEMLSDRDIVMNAVATSTDQHIRFIDEREDLMLERTTEWLDNLVLTVNRGEVERNRKRIIEINYFLDNNREEWHELHDSLAERPDPDTADLLDELFD